MKLEVFLSSLAAVAVIAATAAVALNVFALGFFGAAVVACMSLLATSEYSSRRRLSAPVAVRRSERLPLAA